MSLLTVYLVGASITGIIGLGFTLGVIETDRQSATEGSSYGQCLTRTIAAVIIWPILVVKHIQRYVEGDLVFGGSRPH